MKVAFTSLTLKWMVTTLYLGVVIDQKLAWKPHTVKNSVKALMSMFVCQSLLGREWDLIMAICNNYKVHDCLRLFSVVERKQHILCLLRERPMRTFPTAAIVGYIVSSRFRQETGYVWPVHSVSVGHLNSCRGTIRVIWALKGHWVGESHWAHMSTKVTGHALVFQILKIRLKCNIQNARNGP